MNIEKLKVATKNPKALVEEIIEKMDSKSIRSWKYEDDLLYHQGVQYKEHINFSYNIIDEKSIIEFTLHSDGNSFAESKAWHLFESMLQRHFSDIVEIIK